MERLGLFGGTFDPPHVGHLILASVISDALALERVLFVPAASPPHKSARQITPAEQRLAMLHLALEGDARFDVSLIDVLRPGPHYSVEMVRQARAEYPDSGLYFLMGSDSLLDLHRWYRPDLLIAECMLAVMERPGAPLDWVSLESGLPGLQDRTVVVEGPLVALAASMIRNRIRTGQSVRYLVPDSVHDYIHAEGLYL